jgi:hypothetical protein
MIEIADKFIENVKQSPEEVSTAFLVKCVKALHSSEGEEHTDEEIIAHCSIVIECVVCAVRDSLSPFITSKGLSYEVEEQLISTLLDKAKWYAWLNLAAFGGVDDTFFDRLDEYIKKFKAKVTATWFQEIEQSIQQADAREALKYINEVMFQVKSEERKFKVLGEEVPDDIPHVKGFFSDCFDYLSTKVQLDKDTTNNACFSGVCPTLGLAGKSTFNNMPAGTSGITDISGTKEQNNGAIESTHREVLLAHHYRVEAGLAKPLTRAEMIEAGGPKRYQKSFTLIRRHISYKEPDEKELHSVISVLQEDERDSQALKMAINDLDRLQNS